MRGKIIQYNGADGNGTVVVDGKQHRFALDAWHGDNAPTVNKVVEVTLDNGTVAALAAVGDDVLLKEKAAQLGGKLGSLLNKTPASIPASAGSAGAATTSGDAGAGTATSSTAVGGGISANSIIKRYGKLVLAAYVSFLLGTLVFNAISMSMYGQSMGKSMFDIASAMSQAGSSGGMIKLLLLLAYASIAVPLFWHDRRAWLALAVPLLAVLGAVFSALHAIHSLGGGELSGAFSFSFSFGFYLSLAAALVMAGVGVKRFLVAA